MSDVVLYAFDTMADWEFAHITTVLGFLSRAGDERFRLRVLSRDGQQVTTLGGLRLSPDGALSEVDENAVAALVLPGGNTWAEQEHQDVLALAQRLGEAGITVAAICGATKAVAQHGLLEHRAHVVDADADFPGYPGDRFRTHASVAHDGNMITAIGEAPLEFARELFLALGVEDRAGIDEWYASFKDVPDAR